MTLFTKIALAGVSIVALAAPAFAQDAPVVEDDGGASASSEIVVTARRRDESLQDVPLTVNAVSSEDIQKLNLRDFEDIAVVVPGLTLTSGIRATGSASSLRGVNINNNTSGNNGAVEFYMNDSPISVGAVLQSMYDIGQIEVLRGPQGTLRGRASPSGSITVTTRRPDMDEWGGYVQGTAADIGTYNINGAVNAPIIPGVLALRVAGLYEDSEATRVRSINRLGLESFAETHSYRVSAKLTPLTGLEFNATYQRLVRDSQNFDQVESAEIANPALPASPVLVTARDRLAVANVPTTSYQKFDIFNWQGQWSFAGQRLVYVGSLVKQDLRTFEPADKGDFFDNTFPGDPTLPNNNGTYLSAAAGLNVQNYGQPSRTRTEQMSHEIRLQSEDRVFGMFDYVVGGLITKLTPYTRLNAIRTVNLPARTISNGGSSTPGRVIERAVFGNITAHLGESTEVSGGLRYISYTENTSGSFGTTSIAPPPGQDIFETVGPNNTYKKTIWNGSIKHRFSDDLMVYANAGSSFRLSSGRNRLTLSGAGISAFPDPDFAALIPAIAESSTSYEIGFRSSLFDRRVTFNASAFYQKFNDFIFTVPGGTFQASPSLCTTAATCLPRTINSATAAPVNATVKGIEAEVSYRLSDRFSMAATVAYAKSEATGSIPCGTPDAGEDEQIDLCPIKQSASLAAPFSASVQAEYNQPINTDMDGFVRGLASIYGNSKNDPTNPYDDVKAYALVNLYAGVRAPDGRWELSLYGKNIFNAFRVIERGLAPASVVINNVGVASKYRLVGVTEPREFGLSVRYAFGSR